MDGSVSTISRTLRLLGGLLVLIAFAHLAVPTARSSPAVRDDEVADPYLKRLLDEINLRRKAVGSPGLVFVPRQANDALTAFFGQTVKAIAWPRPCDHQLLDGTYSWDYMQAVAGFGAQAHGEVIACPGPEAYWTPERAAAVWFNSPVHFDILYADSDANALACSTSGALDPPRGQAIRAMAVLCVTFRE